MGISCGRRVGEPSGRQSRFYIFDFCGSFAFFRMSKGKTPAGRMALQGALFKLKAQIVFKPQDIAFQTEKLIALRSTLAADLTVWAGLRKAIGQINANAAA